MCVSCSKSAALYLPYLSIPLSLKAYVANEFYSRCSQSQAGSGLQKHNEKHLCDLGLNIGKLAKSMSDRFVDDAVLFVGVEKQQHF